MWKLIFGGAGLLVGVFGVAYACDQSGKRRLEQAECRHVLAHSRSALGHKDAQIRDAEDRLWRHHEQMRKLVVLLDHYRRRSAKEGVA